VSRSPARCESYLDFVRRHASCVSWQDEFDPWPEEDDDVFSRTSARYPGVVAHHVRMGSGAGAGQKPSDFRAVPLLDHEHERLHSFGEEGYWAEKGIDPRLVMACLLCRWLRIDPDEVAAMFRSAEEERLDNDALLSGLVQRAEAAWRG